MEISVRHRFRSNVQRHCKSCGTLIPKELMWKTRVKIRRPGMLEARSCPRCCSSPMTCTRLAGRMLTSWDWSTRLPTVMIVVYKSHHHYRHLYHCHHHVDENLLRWPKLLTTRCPRRLRTTSSKVVAKVVIISSSQVAFININKYLSQGSLGPFDQGLLSTSQQPSST